MQYLEQTEIEDQLFPSDNILEVPTLREDMQAKAVQIPFVCFGEQRRTYNMQGQGTLHFYTDDYRFRAIYEHPDRILQHNPANIVEPNFSLFNETPIAFGLQHIYKKRFLARACQEKGIRVFVDLNVAPKYYKVNMLGVPRGWSSYCTRGYMDRINQTAFELEMAREWADGTPLLFVVYGGGKPVQEFCRTNRLVYVTPVVSCVHKARSFEKMKESIAFFGQELNAIDLNPALKELPTLDEMLASRIDDYSHDKIE